MSTDHNVSVSITPEQKTDLLGKVAALSTAMDFVVSLSDAQRKTMPRTGDKTLGFDEKCAGYKVNRTDLVPSFVDAEALAKDRQARADVADIRRAVAELAQRLDDTEMVLAHQIYLPDLSFYQNAQLAAKRNVPGAQAIYDDLKSRFPGHPHGATPDVKKQAPASVGA